MEISVIVNQMIILFLLMGMGYFLNKVHILGGAVDTGINKLILYCTIPAMMLNAVLESGEEKEYGVVLTFLAISIAAYAILPFIAWGLTTIMRIPRTKKGVCMFMLIFGNVGFMGFPIISATFGDKYVLYAGIVNMVYNVVAYSYGVKFVSDDARAMNPEGAKAYKFNIKSMLNPGIIFSILAIVIYFINITLPPTICRVVAYLGNLTTPLAMLVVGSILANLNLLEVFTDVKAYLFVAVKNIILPLIIFVLMKLCIKDQMILQVAYLIFIMPIANLSVLFAKEYGSDSGFAAKCMFISTLFSIVTIPLMIFICF